MRGHGAEDVAHEHWDGALAVMERARAPGDARARLLVALADLTVVVGSLARQIGYLEQALGLYEQLGDDERTAQAHSRLGMASSLIDSIYADHLDIRRALPRLRRGARGADARARSQGTRPPRSRLSTALTYGLQIERGIEATGRAVEIAEQLGDEALWASATEACAWHKIVAGDLREGSTRSSARSRARIDSDGRSSPGWRRTWPGS